MSSTVPFAVAFAKASLAYLRFNSKGSGAVVAPLDAYRRKCYGITMSVLAFLVLLEVLSVQRSSRTTGDVPWRIYGPIRSASAHVSENVSLYPYFAWFRASRAGFGVVQCFFCAE